jgi:hypothetical protein
MSQLATQVQPNLPLFRGSLSFANTFAALGIRKDLINPQLLNGLTGWLRVIAAIQTILGIVLLFLFGLGIRNRFRSERAAPA